MQRPAILTLVELLVVMYKLQLSHNVTMSHFAEISGRLWWYVWNCSANNIASFPHIHPEQFAWRSSLWPNVDIRHAWTGTSPNIWHVNVNREPAILPLFTIGSVGNTASSHLAPSGLREVINLSRRRVVYINISTWWRENASSVSRMYMVFHRKTPLYRLFTRRLHRHSRTRASLRHTVQTYVNRAKAKVSSIARQVAKPSGQ